MEKHLRTAAWIAGCGFVTWLIVFGSVWMVRSGCAGHLTLQYCNGGAFLDWVGDVVMLGWVKDYQTLLSGLIALLAGSAVLAASYLQIREARREAARLRTDAIRAALTAVRAVFMKTLMVTTAQEAATVASPVSAVESVSGVLSAADALLVGNVLTIAMIVEDGLRALSSTAAGSPNTVRRGRAYSLAMMLYFANPNRFISTSGEFKAAKLPLASLRKNLIDFEFGAINLKLAQHFFE